MQDLEPARSITSGQWASLASVATTAQIDAAVTAAQAARDAAIISSGVYATEALGRAAVADGAYFRVVGSGLIACYEYVRVNSGTSALVATFPSSNFVQKTVAAQLLGSYNECFETDAPITTVNLTDAATITKTATYTSTGMTIDQTVGSRMASHSTPFSIGGKRTRLTLKCVVNAFAGTVEVGAAFGSGASLIGYSYTSGGRVVKYAGGTPTGLAAGNLFVSLPTWTAGATITWVFDLSTNGSAIITVSDGTNSTSFADTGIPQSTLSMLQLAVSNITYSAWFESTGGLLDQAIGAVALALPAASTSRDMQAWFGYLSSIQRDTPSGLTPSLPYSVRVTPYQAAGSRRFFTDVVLSKPINDSAQGNVVVYVDPVSGNDSNAGTSALPYKSLSKALATAAVTLTIYAKPGLYDRTLSWAGVAPIAMNVQVVPWGVGSVVSSMHHAGLVWTLSAGSMYTTTITTAGTVFDATNLTADGDYTGLTLVGSSATCQATANSYYVSGTTIYMRTFDSRTPDSSIRVYTTGTNGTLNISTSSLSGHTSYLESIEFEGGSNGFYTTIASSSYSGTLYAKSCTFKYSGARGTSINGQWLVVSQSCIAAHNFSDGFNYHSIFGSTGQKVLEIDCIGRWNGRNADGTNNGSTVHDASTIVVRVGGDYHHNEDRNIHDIGGSYSWNLGCTARDSRTAGYCNFAAGLAGDPSSTHMWLDNCTSSGSTYDLEAAVGLGVIATSGLTVTASNVAGGTITTYTP